MGRHWPAHQPHASHCQAPDKDPEGALNVPPQDPDLSGVEPQGRDTWV